MDDKIITKHIPYSRVKVLGVLAKLDDGNIHQVMLSENEVNNIMDVIIAHDGPNIRVKEEPIRTVDLVYMKKNEIGLRGEA